TVHGLLCFVALSVPLATVAGDVEDVAAVARLWAETIGRADPDAMVQLYHEDAVLHGTRSPVVRRGHAAIREYFAEAAKNPGLGMKLAEPMLIRVYGDIAINTGNYSVTLTENGQPRTIPLRYSFVYRKTDGQWKIVDHHSSTIPEPPPSEQTR
ncbi:MAG TPA: SgcJ/EcaC family oxidoreductase, partial [Gammaproteobacteria bacterium]